MAARRNHPAIAPCRPDDFADIQIASGVDAQVMGSEEVAWRTRIPLAGPTSQEATLEVEHANAGTRQVRTRRSLPRKHSGMPTDLGNENAVAAVDKNLHRPRHIRPLGEE